MFVHVESSFDFNKTRVVQVLEHLLPASIPDAKAEAIISEESCNRTKSVAVQADITYSWMAKTMKILSASHTSKEIERKSQRGALLATE